MLASDPSDCNTTKDSNFYIKNFCESNMYANKKIRFRCDDATS